MLNFCCLRILLDLCHIHILNNVKMTGTDRIMQSSNSFIICSAGIWNLFWQNNNGNKKKYHLNGMHDTDRVRMLVPV